MTREEAIREACSIVALAYRSIGDYSRASDGFCDNCVDHCGPHWSYQNSGLALQYVREAVVLRLKADGYKISQGFDKTTGRELKP